MWSYIWQSQILMIIIHCLPKENIHLVAISLLLMTHLLYQYIAVVYVDSYSYYRVTDANKLAIMVVYTRQNDNPEVSLWYALELYHQFGFAENKTHHFSNNTVMFYTSFTRTKTRMRIHDDHFARDGTIVLAWRTEGWALFQNPRRLIVISHKVLKPWYWQVKS